MTTNHIAAHIGISPGNLYYWYADKSEIVRALWVRFAAERSALREFDEVLPGPDELVERVVAGTVALGERYAFLTRELHALVHADAALRALHVADRSRRLGILTTVVRSWWADGLLTVAGDTASADLVRALWVLTEHWYADTAAVGRPDVADARRLLRAVLEPLRGTRRVRGSDPSGSR